MSSTESSSDATVDDEKSMTAEPASESPSQSSSEISGESKTPAKKQKPAKPKSSRFPTFIFLLFILILLGVSAAGYYYWQQLQTTLNSLQNDVAFNVSKLDKSIPRLDQAREDIIKQQQIIEQLQKTNTEQLQRLSDFHKAQQTMMQSMQNVFDITHRNQRQWLLAEVSYLLSLANQRLLVSRDIKSAIAALKSANNRLHDLSDPSLLKLRKKITEETAALNLLQLPDINGIAFSLDNSLPLISLLPFKSAQQKNIEGNIRAETIELAEMDKDSYFSPLWQRIKSLVTIKKHNREIQSTETPIEKNDIDNQIRFRIEAARLALINQNTKIFNHEMLTSSELLSLYYDTNDNRVKQLVNELISYTKVILQPKLPDITGSWKMLQTVLAINNATAVNNKAGDETNSKKGKSIQ